VRAQTEHNEDDPSFTRGPLISRFSFTIDTREWGFNSPRADLVRKAREKPEIRAITEADVWDQRAEDQGEPPPEAAGDLAPAATNEP
jgi:hypothetical protein